MPFTKILLATATASLALSLGACKGAETDAAKNSGAAATQASATKIAQIAPPAGKTWEETVVKTPEGGFRMGNPDAKVKIIEYASLTCSHCADFSKTAGSELKSRYIASGQVSWEMRNYFINSLDIVPSAITHCAGAERYFPLTENIFATQGELFTLAEAADKNALNNLQALPKRDQIPALAKVIKLDQFFKARGITDAEINSCLANTDNFTALEKTMADGNKQYNIVGTPTFIIDGKKAEFPQTAPLWQSLQAALNEKLG